MTERATEIPMDDCGLVINCGRDGTWLHFTASSGKHSSINVDLMNRGGIIGNALRDWCADRQKQAEKIREDTVQSGVKGSNQSDVDYFKDVGLFHAKFGLPYYGDGYPPQLLEPGVFAFRLKFILEEAAEFAAAHAAGDIVGVADALADLIYVAAGSAHFLGLPLDDVWREVQRANMAKVRAESAADPRSKRRHAMDVVKPENWIAPNHVPAIEAAREMSGNKRST